MIWRLFEGELADEVYIQCRAASGPGGDIARQTTVIYRAIQDRLIAFGGSLGNVVYQTAFFRDIRSEFASFHPAFTQAFRDHPEPASMFIGQTPLDDSATVTVSAVAVIPHDRRLSDEAFSNTPPVRVLNFGKQRVLYSGALYGEPGPMFDQTRSMFGKAIHILQAHGMDFADVVRTWIYLRDIDRDYAEFNRARRHFIRQMNLGLLPASTGIHGTPQPHGADLALSFCAVQSSDRSPTASAMTTPTLNEAPTYGSDFSRGLRVNEPNKTALYLSGTASVDEEGRTAHVGDCAAQVERMLLNVETLLHAQGASFGNVLSAVTYLKHPSDASVFRRILNARGLREMPNVVVHAAVCRPDLLCEMEAVAALPASGL